MMVYAVDVNLVGVLIAAVASMILGSLWYSPILFGKPWARMMGFDSKKMKGMKSKGVAKLYLINFVAGILLAYVFAHLLAYTGASTIFSGMQVGIWLWFGFAIPMLLGSVLWEGKPLSLYLINVFYYLVDFIIIGAILVSW